MKNILILIFASLFFNYRPTLASRTNFKIKSAGLCNNNTQGLFTYNASIFKEGDDYYIDGYIKITLPLDENIGVTCKIESKVSKDMYMELFTIREKYFCKACNIYLGEFWYGVQRAAQVPPGRCPMPPKRYEVHHTLLDFKRVSLQTFPFGTLRFTVNIVHNKNLYRNLFCAQVVVENIPSI